MTAQRPEHAARAVTLAYGVNQHPYLHAARLGAGQRSQKCGSSGIVVKDVGQQRDRVRGGIDGGQHGRVGLVPVDQGRDGVARQQRLAGDAAGEVADAGEFGQARVMEGGWLIGAVRLPTPGSLEPQCHASSLDAVDPQHHIRQGPAHRRQPGQRNPAQRLVHVWLVQEHMHGDAHRAAQMEQRQEQRRQALHHLQDRFQRRGCHARMVAGQFGFTPAAPSRPPALLSRSAARGGPG